MNGGRRDFLKAFGMLAGAAALDAAWPLGAVAQTSGNRASGFIRTTHGAAWQNKHLNLHERVNRIYDVWNSSHGSPAGTADAWRGGFSALQSILEDAQTAGLRVRAVGGQWSLSPVAVSPDVMINTMPLNFHAVGLPACHVSSTAVEPAHLVFAQCGTSVCELSETLEARRLSLPTSGASNGQTICGAIATGTHGSARRIGSMQDYILGLHILAGDGRHFWIEPASKPVVSEKFCAWLGATLIRNDKLFYAALVSMGSFGIVHAVLFEATPIYLLEVHRRRLDFDQAKRVAFTLDTDGLGLPYPGVEPFHLDVAINPYRLRRGGKGAVVTAMYKRPYEHVSRRQSRDGQLVPAADLLSIGGVFATMAPATVPAGISRTFDRMMKGRGAGMVGRHSDVFPTTELRGRSLSSETGVALVDAEAAVETVLDTARRGPFPGLIGLRYVQRSRAALAFTKFDTTCTIEATGAGSGLAIDFYHQAATALATRGIPFTQHWGKINSTSRANIRERWGSAVDEWIDARRSFLTPAARTMFSNDMLKNCGLDG